MSNFSSGSTSLFPKLEMINNINQVKILGEKRKKCQEDFLHKESNKKPNIDETKILKKMGLNIFDYFPNDIMAEIGIKYLQMLASLKDSKMANLLFLKFILLNKNMSNLMKTSMKIFIKEKEISDGVPLWWGIQIWTIKNSLTSTLIIPYWREKFEIISNYTLDLIKKLHIHEISPPSLKFISKLKNIHSLQTDYYDETFHENNGCGDLFENILEYWNHFIPTSKISHLTVDETFLMNIKLGNLTYLSILGKVQAFGYTEANKLKELIIEIYSEFFEKWSSPLLEKLTISQRIDKNNFESILSWIPEYLPKLKYLYIDFDSQTTTKEEFNKFKETLENNNPNLIINK